MEIKELSKIKEYQKEFKQLFNKTLEINWFEAVIAVVDAVLLDIVANDELVGKDYDLT